MDEDFITKVNTRTVHSVVTPAIKRYIRGAGKWRTENRYWSYIKFFSFWNDFYTDIFE